MRKKLIILLAIAIVIIGASGGYFYYKHFWHKSVASKNQTGDIYVSFLGEIWDKVKQNYWDKEPDDQLASLYKLGAEKIIGQPQIMETQDKNGMIKIVTAAMKSMDNAKKKDFVTQLGDVVVANLKPFGRSRLYGQAQQQALVNTVENKAGTDLYALLGVSKDASQQEINKAYDAKAKSVDSKTADGQKQLADLNQAKQTLANTGSRQNYDQNGVEPTVIYQTIGTKTFYMHIKKISPQTFNEFQKAVATTSKNNNLETLIVDLRGNVGGAIDTLPYFLGPFVGPNSYAYDFFHQGDYMPFKTATGWMNDLVKFKKVVVLIDGEVQSSAEVMAAAFKKFNVGVVVGTHTKGWGTVEQMMPMDTQIDPNEKFTLLLVQSLTLRDDGQPIEGQGIDPTIDITNKNWQKQLLDYYNLPYIVDAVKTALTLKN